MPEPDSPAPARHDRLPVLVASAFAAAALWTVGTTLWIDWYAYSALPWGDHWDHWRTTVQSGYSPSMFFSQHNEHRIALTRALFWIDEQAFGATNIFIFAAILLVQFLHAVLLWRIALRAGIRSTTESIAVAALCLSAMFSAHQFTNFTWAFQIQFVMVYLFATLAFYGGYRAAERSGSRPTAARWLACAVVAAWAATYSMANGLIAWPFLLLLLVWNRAPRGQMAVVAVNAVAAWVLYLWGYSSPPHHGSAVDGLLNLPASLVFAAAYLGSPVDQALALVGVGDPGVRAVCAAVAGLLGVALAARHAVRAVLDRDTYRDAQVLLLHVVGFTVAAAGMTGLGRATRFPLIDAVTSRYVTPALVFWIGLILLEWSVRRPSGSSAPQRTPLAFQAVVLTLLVTIVGTVQWPRIAYVQGYSNYLAEVEAAVVSNVYDRDIWRRIYYAPDTLPPVVDYLREHHLSVFQQDWTAWPGTPFNDRFAVRPGGECLGSFDVLSPVASPMRPGFSISGWAWDLNRRTGPDRVVFVNDAGLIMGSTRVRQTRPDVPRAIGDVVTTAEVGWHGFVETSTFTRIDAFMVREAEATACLVGTMPVAASATLLPVRAAGEAYPGVTFDAGEGWTLNGTYPSVGVAPLTGEMYGSWSGADANTGILRVGPIPLTASAGRIDLPFVTGPVVTGLSITLTESPSGRVLATLAPPPGSQTWSVLQIEFEARDTDTAVEIVARDDGAGWGQWMAIGAPRRATIP